MKGNFLKAGGVVLGALVIATLGISASSLIPQYLNQLSGQSVSALQGGCPAGMTSVPGGKTFSCVDTFEASASTACKNKSPESSIQTQANLNENTCKSVSQKAVLPWTYVSREQAKVLCMRAGKRLPSASEWYTFALGTPDNVCNVHAQGAVPTGNNTECRSAANIMDTIGNVWEWTSDDVIEGVYNGRALPSEGYVQQVADDGIATVTGVVSEELFGSDYLWTQSSGIFAIVRGGFYGSEEDAGVYAVQAKTSPNASAIAIGFRCVL